MSFTSTEQPEQGQDPQVTPDPTTAAPTAPPAAPPPAPPVGSGPWSADLAQRFEDEATRGQVDQFIRERVQPYTTQLEQQSAQAKDALRLWESFSSSPIDTYVQVTEELYGPEAAQALLATLQQHVGQQPAQPPAQGQAPPQQPNDPRLETFLQWAEQQQTTQLYDSELNRIKGTHPDVDEDLFHPFVAAADGNFDEAYNLYARWVAEYGAKTSPPPEPVQAAPALGSDTQTAAPSNTPTEPKKQTLDGAIEDFMREQREARQAPPIGTV